jgi:ankyrin repeat protein
MMAAGSSDAPVRAWLDPDSGAPFETAKLLLEAGSNANAKDNYRRTALMTAARSGNAEIVKLLLEAGADVKAKDEGGRNALQIAIDESRDEIIQMLTKAGDE